MNHEEVKSKIFKAYNRLNANTLDSLDEFYSTDIEFRDAIGVVIGLVNLKNYYGKIYKNVKSISFEFHDFIIQDQNVVATWSLTFSAKGLNSGDHIKVSGNSYLKFREDGLVYYHRDYLDMGEMIYENIPLLGFIIKKIKQSLE